MKLGNNLYLVAALTMACAGADGADGTDGKSPEVSVRSASASDCPNGGSELTVGDETIIICNGADGADGAKGDAGPAGADGGQGCVDPASEAGKCSCSDPPELSVEQLCNGLDDFLGTEFTLDLSGEVVERHASTAIACVGDDAGAPECCNWTWTAYAIACPDFDIVLTGNSAPYGSKTAPGNPGFSESVEVTMGCQGMDCEPTCAPSVSELRRVRARLESAADGQVVPGDQFEPFLAEAALEILEAL